MKKEVRDYNAAMQARYSQAASYTREHEDEYVEMDKRLLEATGAYLDFATEGGLAPHEALGDLLRHIFMSYAGRPE